MTTVLIADDSALVRDRLYTALSDLEDVEVVGQAQSGLEAIESIRKLKPEVVILDIRMPSGTGIDVLQNIKNNGCSPIVIVLTNYPFPQYRRKCLDAGADFFFDKSIEFLKITEVLKKLSRSFR
ncbi:MAG: response regulator transcription factor [bacterium]